MEMQFIDRTGMRVNSPMWGDMTFPYIERNETRESSLSDIIAEISEWQYILERLSHQPRAVIKSVTWNGRLKKTLGRCRLAADGAYLEFNPTYMHMCDSDSFHETIAHEVIHTLPGSQNHGAFFKTYAGILGNVTKVKVARRSKDKAYGDYINESRAKRRQYEITCVKCGRTYLRLRRSPLVAHPEQYRCATCKGKLIVKEMKED